MANTGKRLRLVISWVVYRILNISAEPSLAREPIHMASQVGHYKLKTASRMFSIFLDACSIETRGERYWGGLSPLEGYLDPPPRALNLNLFPFPFPSFNVDPRLAVLLQQNKSGVNCDVNSCRNSGSTRATSVSVIGRRPGPIDIDCLKAFTRRSANKNNVSSLRRRNR